MKKYKTLSWGYDITEQEITSETGHTITYLNKSGKIVRENKLSSYAKWHDSKTDAIKYLKDRITSNISALSNKIIAEQDNLRKFNEKHNLS